MTTHKKHDEKEVVFYCTITCYNWLPLFEITNFYDAIYTWFEILRKLNNQVNGYVIMPNHLHVLIHVDKESAGINKLVGNGKRFMAYEMVERLKKAGNNNLLTRMQDAVREEQKAIGKLHHVFEPSFDCKPCFTKKFMEQKLDYIHRNPCSGKWNLVAEFTHYKHSSAAFYELDALSGFAVDDCRLLEW